MVSAKVPETVKVPALIVVSPEYVLEPDKVKIPVPALVKDPDPEITPETAVSYTHLTLPTNSRV